MTASRGKFITFEGIDGSGKSTQAGMLCNWLKEVLRPGGVLRTFEPGDWDGGPLLRRLLLEGAGMTPRTELLLFLADRAGHLDAKILPALEKGVWVVCERYTDSTLAYQSWGRGLALKEIQGLLDGCRFPKPDMTLLLNIGEEAAAARLGRRGELDRIESSGPGFMARVAQGYRELALMCPERFEVLDASMTAEAVAAAVRGRVEKLTGGRK
ncbi:MAG: dTMP kinase [Synergistaceae bacterium]|jgi:dTMP kinase|nr:dTMP kinase [Synergistaceae bacterium]